MSPSHWIQDNHRYVQKSDIRSIDPGIIKFGTFSLLDLPQMEDARFSLRCCSLDNDILGFMFRVQPDISLTVEPKFSYYHFTLDSQYSTRRLIRKTGNSAVVLWQDTFKYVPGIYYNVSIEMTYNKIYIWFNGSLIAEVVDNNFLKGAGQIGFSSWANHDAIFEKVFVTDITRKIGVWEIVDEGINDAPSGWKAKDGRLQQTSNINTNVDPAIPGTYIFGGDAGWNNYSVTVTGKSNANNILGILFRYQDHDNYYAFVLSAQNNYRRLLKKQSGVVSILAQESKGFEIGTELVLRVDLLDVAIQTWVNGDLSLDIMDNSLRTGKVGIYCWANDSLEIENILVTMPALAAYTLYKDTFDSGSLTEWNILNEGDMSTPSKWVIQAGILKQLSNIYSDAAGRNNAGKKGTIITTGHTTWTNYIVSVRMRSDDNDELGIVFRFIDSNNHYRYVVQKELALRRLELVKAGVASILWEDNFAYETGKDYDTIIVANEDVISVYINQLLTAQVKNAALFAGKIGLYCWANENTSFSNIRVYDIRALDENYFFQDKFEGPLAGGWQITDESAVGAPSEWVINSSVLLEDHAVGDDSEMDALPDKYGTYASNLTILKKDFRMTVECSSENTNGIGLMFGFQNANNYYRFSMDSKRNFVRLSQRLGGIMNIIWSGPFAFVTGRKYMLGIDCVGGSILGYINGINQFKIKSPVSYLGKFGLYSFANDSASFYQVLVQNAIWLDYYVFRKEKLYSDGSVFRIYSANPTQLGVDNDLPGQGMQRFVPKEPDQGIIHFSSESQKIRLIDKKGTVIDENTFIKSSDYSSLVFRMIRKADSTGIYLLPSVNGGKFDAASYRLKFIFKRNPGIAVQTLSQFGDRSDESAILFLPWETNT